MAVPASPLESTFAGPVAETRRLRAQREFLRRFMKQPLGVLGLLVFAAMVVMAIIGPTIAPADPYALGSQRLQAPSWEHLAGTDHLGRDFLSRVIYGIRPSIAVAVAALAAGVTTGSLIGVLSAYFGGAVDLSVQRVMDAVDALPSLFLGILVLTVISPSYTSLTIAIAFVMVPAVQRVVRSAALAEKQRDYVTASRTLGAGQGRIVFRHILPNILSPILVIASAELGSAILIAASLSFLGFGTPPPEPSLGAMVSGEGRQHMERAPWLVIVPSVVISLAVLSVNFLGDALRDVLDPRLRI